MAFLTIATTTIEVSAVNGVRREDEEIGDRTRAFDGTLRSTIRARKKVWRITTKPLTATEADSIESAITATASLSCSGDLVSPTGGNVTCHVELEGSRYDARTSDSRGFRRQLEFKLHEE